MRKKNVLIHVFRNFIIVSTTAAFSCLPASSLFLLEITSTDLATRYLAWPGWLKMSLPKYLTSCCLSWKAEELNHDQPSLPHHYLISTDISNPRHSHSSLPFHNHALSFLLYLSMLFLPHSYCHFIGAGGSTHSLPSYSLITSEAKQTCRTDAMGSHLWPTCCCASSFPL